MIEDPVTVAKRESDSAEEFARGLMEHRVTTDAFRLLDPKMRGWVISYFDFRALRSAAALVVMPALVFFILDGAWAGSASWAWLATAIAFVLVGLRQVPRIRLFVRCGHSLRRTPAPD